MSVVKTEILSIKGTWQDVVDDCRSTVSKPPLGKEPSKKFKRDILIAEHGPIRSISIRWVWKGLKSWIATHFCRHKWECFISTQRTDRTGVNRDEQPQSAPVIFRGDANVQAYIDTSRKRLCFMASNETRQQWENLKVELHPIEPEISEIGVPNCIYRGGCPELNEGCGFWKKFLERHPEITTNTSIQERYDIYNKEFYNSHK